jgi:hypothetical protein
MKAEPKQRPMSLPWLMLDLSEMPMEDLAGAMKRRWDQGLNRYLAQRRRDPETLETVETDSPIPPLDLACISAGGRDGG